MTATAQRQPAEALNVKGRLKALAAALPQELPGLEALQNQILALSGESEDVEAQLESMDQNLLASLEESLPTSERDLLKAEVEAALQTLRQRLPKEAVEKAQHRLWVQKLRERHAVPILSLFSVEDPP